MAYPSAALASELATSTGLADAVVAPACDLTVILLDRLKSGAPAALGLPSLVDGGECAAAADLAAGYCCVRGAAPAHPRLRAHVWRLVLPVGGGAAALAAAAASLARLVSA